MTPEGTKPPLHVLGTPSAKSVKGKHKEEENLQLGWWDILPLIEGQKPPLQWLNTSTILTAHANEPKVVGLHYPTNKQFVLPSPAPISNSPSSYEPAKVISATASGFWAFAFFPGIGTEGVGCIWRRMPQVDNWVVKDCWPFPREGGAVAAQWFSNEREWVLSESGLPARLPGRGPNLPLMHPILLVVTESHFCNIYYTHPQSEASRVLSAFMRRQGIIKDGDQRINGDRVDGPGGLGRVTHAAIGIGYGESSMIIATHSTYVPSSETRSTFNVDLSIPLGMSNPQTETDSPALPEWETPRNDNIIELCEISFGIHGWMMGIATHPLPPIQLSWQSSNFLTDLVFIPTLPTLNHALSAPTTPTQTHRHTTPVSSPAMANAHVNHSPGRPGARPAVKGSPRAGVDLAKALPIPALYLLCTSLDLGQYSSSPRSEVTLHTIFRDITPHQGTLQRRSWVHRRFSTLPLQTGIVTHVSPCQPTNYPLHCGALIGVLNIDIPIPRAREGKRVRVGKFVMVRLPELQIDDTWQPVSMFCPMNSFGVDLPFNTVVSPNRALICTISSASMSPHKISTTIYPHPLRMGLHEYGGPNPRKMMASSLVVAIQRGAMPSDIAHFLALTVTPIHLVEEVLIIILRDFKDASNGLTTVWTNKIIGVAIDIYRQKSLSSRSLSDKDELSCRCVIASQIISLSSCLKMWELCSPDGRYEIDAMWLLIGACGFFVEFTTKLLKECVMFFSELIDDKTSDNALERENDLYLSPGARTWNLPSSFDMSSEMVHLVHPFTFNNVRNVLQHVRRFYGYLKSKSLRTEAANMGREVLTDLIDSSGVDLEALENVLTDFSGDVKAVSEHFPDSSYKALATLKPTSQHAPYLRKIVTAIINARVVDKVRLFVVPEDLVDGMIGLSTGSGMSLKVHDRNVITKAYLTNVKGPMNVTCLRCNGSAEIGLLTGLAASFERQYLTQCECGGLWSTRH